MTDFLLVFRRDIATQQGQLSPEQMHAMMKPWQDWLDNLAAGNNLVSPGNRLVSVGKVIRPGNIVTSGPYVELNEGIGGYIVVRTETMDDAVELSMGCPILSVGGSVEVRPVVGM